MEQENLSPEQTPVPGAVMDMALPDAGDHPGSSGLGTSDPVSADEANQAGEAQPTPAEAFIRSLAPALQDPSEFGLASEARESETAVRQSADQQHSEKVQRVKYAPLQPGGVEAPLHNIDYLKDINLEAGVELGNTSMSVEQILGLGVGSIIELNQTVGEPVRLLINSHIYAQGEVVVIGDKFGIRISKIAQA